METNEIKWNRMKLNGIEWKRIALNEMEGNRMELYDIAPTVCEDVPQTIRIDQLHAERA